MAEERHRTDHARDLASLYDIEAHRVDPPMLDAADAALDRAEAEVLLARGRAAHARYLQTTQVQEGEMDCFERAAQLFLRAEDDRGQGEAAFWTGVFHQVVRRDIETALPHLHRAGELAGRTGDTLLLSCVERHLGFVAVIAGRPDEAREHLETSVQLRRDIGFRAGTAAALLALAEWALAGGETGRARQLLDEARALAVACGADTLTGLVEEVREQTA